MVLNKFINLRLEEYYEKFKQIIALEKFKPVSEKNIEETSSLGVKDIGERSKPFNNLLKEMNKKLHQGDQKRLETLINVNANFNKFSKEIFFEKKHERPVEIKTYSELNMVKTHNLLSDWKECMIQANESIKSMVREVKSQIDLEIQNKLKAASHASARKNIGESTIPKEIVDTLMRFQSLVNFIFERGIRGSFENSVSQFIGKFSDVLSYLSECLNMTPEEFQSKTMDIEDIRKIADDAIFKHRMKKRIKLKCELKYNPKEGVYFHPRIEGWKSTIVNIMDEAIKLIMNCQCLFTSDLGYARETKLVLVIADPETDPFVVKQKALLENVLTSLIYVPMQLQEIGNKYRHILDSDKDSFQTELLKEGTTNEEYRDQLQKLKSAKERLETLFPENEMFLGIFEVNCTSVREFFSQQITKLNKLLFKCIKARISQDSDRIDDAVKEVMNQLQTTPPAIEELVEQNKFLNTIETRRVDIQNIIFGVFSKIGLLEEYQHKLTEKELERTFEAFLKTLDVVKIKRMAVLKNSTLWGEYKDQLRSDTSVLLSEAGTLKEKLDSLQTQQSLKDYEKIWMEYNQLGEQINKATATAELIASREKLFMQQNTSFEELYNTKRLFTPYENFWTITRDYNIHEPQWRTGAITELDREKVREEVHTAIATLKKYIDNDFLADPGAQQIANTVLQYFIDFKPMLPLIYDLRNPAMQERHWKILRRDTKIEIPEGLQISLQELRNKGIENFKEQINEISDYATKERALMQVIAFFRLIL